MIVDNYDYPDTCIISRTTGETNDNGDETFSQIFAGVCEIQYGGSTNRQGGGGVAQSSPMLFIPVSSLQLELNDKVEVSSINNRKSRYTIGQFECSLEFDDTCIWLKGGVDV